MVTDHGPGHSDPGIGHPGDPQRAGGYVLWLSRPLPTFTTDPAAGDQIVVADIADLRTAVMAIE